MGYIIKEYTYKQAKKLGVIVKPSIRTGKKIDVYDNDGKLICSVGDVMYSDYPTYIQTHGKAYAETRRYLYRVRHRKDMQARGSPGWYASKLLW